MEAGGVKAGQRGRGSPPSTTTSTAPAKSRRGGIISSQWAPSRAPIIRLVCADGRVRDISEAVSAAEALSLQDHESIAAAAAGGRGSCSKLVGSSSGSSASLICDSAALRVGKRACPMHPDAQLEEGHLYYVLPIPAFQHRLRWSYISYLAAMAAAAAPSTSSSSAAPPASLPSSSSSLARIPFLINFLLRRRRRHRGTFSTKVDDAEMRSGAGANSPANKLVQLHSGTADCRRAFHNVCNYSPEANNKYVEQLIERSKSWRPPLLTIHE